MRNLDLQNEAKLSNVNPILAQKIRQIIALAKQKGYQLVIVEGMRSYATQAKYYAQGRTTAGQIITYKKAGTSKHETGNAVDLGFLRNGKLSQASGENWAIIGQLARQVGGLVWGGDWASFKDKPHLELATGTKATSSNSISTYQTSQKTDETWIWFAVAGVLIFGALIVVSEK